MLSRNSSTGMGSRYRQTLEGSNELPMTRTKRQLVEARQALADCYWMIKGEDPVQELLAVERRLTKALTDDEP